MLVFYLILFITLKYYNILFHKFFHKKNCQYKCLSHVTGSIKMIYNLVLYELNSNDLEYLSFIYFYSVYYQYLLFHYVLYYIFL